MTDMHGKTALVTGANTGIGKEIAVGLARQGARLLFTSRDDSRGRAALEDIRQRGESDAVEFVHLDLASLASVRECARDVLERCEHLDVFVANAGGVWSQRRLTHDGLEMTLGVNHFGHFALTAHLLDRLKASAPARIVLTASGAHRTARRGIAFDDLRRERRYRGMQVYGESKLANILFTRELTRRLERTDVTVNCFHPGFVASEFGQGGDTTLLALGARLGRVFARSPERGAETGVWLASAPELEGVSGGYYFDRKLARLSRAARDDDAAARLWDVSEELVGPMETAA
jgi:NAD(P)-dependent dehydrogenase (short-subunit alcohol dehydrogenase family)